MAPGWRRFGLRGNRFARESTDVFGDEGANATNVADHGAALDLVGPDGGFIDGGSGRAKTRDAEGDASQGDDGNGHIHDAADFLGVCVGWSLDVHSVAHSDRSAIEGSMRVARWAWEIGGGRERPQGGRRLRRANVIGSLGSVWKSKEASRRETAKEPAAPAATPSAG